VRLSHSNRVHLDFLIFERRRIWTLVVILVFSLKKYRQTSVCVFLLFLFL
jgi:hypothetical protein